MSLFHNLPFSIVREIILFYGIDEDQKKKMNQVMRGVVNYIPWKVIIKKKIRTPISPRIYFDEFHDPNRIFCNSRNFQMNHDIIIN